MPETKTSQIPEHPVWALAELAGCSGPDSPVSAGAVFLHRVQSSVIETIEYAAANDESLEDTAHEIADSAIPVGTYDLWKTFVDLGAWEAFDDYRDEMGSGEVKNDHGDGMTAQAAVALYWIARRLAEQLIEDESGEDR